MVWGGCDVPSDGCLRGSLQLRMSSRRLVDLLLEQAAHLRAAAEPQTGFFTFFRQIVADAARKKALADALQGAGIDVKTEQADQRAQMREALTNLLHTAQRVGAVRPDVGTPEILALLRGATMAAETGDYYSGPVLDRALAVLFDGLRPSAPPA